MTDEKTDKQTDRWRASESQLMCERTDKQGQPGQSTKTTPSMATTIHNHNNFKDPVHLQIF